MLALSTPAPGALPFGSTPAQGAALLGPPLAVGNDGAFHWRSHRHGAMAIRLDYYREKLGRVRLEPNRPLAWKAAWAWARVLVPELAPEALHRDDPTRWLAFTPIHLGKAPFEAEWTFHRRHDHVWLLEGEIHWLD